ncbi:MAG: bifunctional riboflavin kinase/FAD synthetase [Alphaproteobacteria bacterium]
MAENKPITDLNKYPDDLKNCVVVLGNFDGVHLGHQELVINAKKMADDKNKPLVILTFALHPKYYFLTDSQPFTITSLQLKTKYMKDLGANDVVALDFEKVKDMTSNEFMQNILIDGIGASVVVAGYDFKFGKGRDGNIDTLKTNNAFETLIIDEVIDSDGSTLASTTVRTHIKSGDIKKVNSQLGRNFEITGTVSKGQQLGATIGFPTANIKLDKYTIRPKYGVYAVKLNILGEDKMISGVANFGIRPTVDNPQETLEVHLFDFDKDIYEQDVSVQFIDFIREEKKFSGLEELKSAINNDCDVAKKIHLEN